MCLKRFRRLGNTPEGINLSELERDIGELKANYELSRIRKFTKIILIGFFIGRSAEQKVSELTLKIQKRIMDAVSDVSKLTQEIRQSGTYLIYPKKASCISKIESVKSEIGLCEKNKCSEHRFHR